MEKKIVSILNKVICKIISFIERIFLDKVTLIYIDTKKMRYYLNIVYLFSEIICISLK